MQVHSHQTEHTEIQVIISNQYNLEKKKDI